MASVLCSRPWLCIFKCYPIIMMILHKNSDPRNLMWLPIGRRGINPFWTVVSVFTCAALSELIDVLMSAVAWAWGMRVYFIADEAMILMCADLRGDMIIVTKRIIKSSEHLLAAGTNFVDNNLEQSWCLRNILNLSQRSGLRKNTSFIDLQNVILAFWW